MQKVEIKYTVAQMINILKLEKIKIETKIEELFKLPLSCNLVR